jgi:hypothetical protein
MYRRHSRNSKTTKIKNMRKQQIKEQIKKIIEALNKHQSKKKKKENNNER